MNTKKLLNRMGGLVKCTAVAVIGAAAAFASGEAGAATCTYDGSWDTTPSSAEDEIVIVSGDLTWGTSLPPKVKSWTQAGGTVTFATTYETATGVTLFPLFEVSGDVSLTGGVWTHLKNSNNKKNYRLYVKVGGDMAIGADATVHADACGYPANYRTESAYAGSGSRGGSYGGFGHSTGSPDAPFGRYYAPDDIGSGNWDSSYGGASGGSVRLVVTGALAHEGLISSGGSKNSYAGGHYGGSGGSIWITAGAISGKGLLTAPAAANNYPGSGGRIAVILTGDGTDFSDYDILNQASALAAKTGCSSPGTIYAETAVDTPNEGWLIIKGDGTARSPWQYNGTPFSLQVTSAHFAHITVTNNIYMSVETGMTLDLRGTRVDAADKAGVQNGFYFAGGSSVLPSDRFDVNYGLTIAGGGSWSSDRINVLKGGQVDIRTQAMTMKGELMVTNGAVVTVRVPLTIVGNLRLDGGTMQGAGSSSTPVPLDLTVAGDLTIATNGTLTVEGMGYSTGLAPITKAGSQSSGSHGGQGGALKDADSASKPYDDVRNPTQAGAGGAWQVGGGILLVNVAGTVYNDGMINASGQYTGSWSYQGGYYLGAGGTVNMTCGCLRGKGVIMADGNRNGSCNDATGSGGGRVAVRVTKAGETFAPYQAAGGRFTAYGSRTSTKSRAGGAGTVYLRTASEALDEGTLIVDNKWKSNASNVTPLGGDVTGLGVGSVIVTNGAKLKLEANTTLVVKGNWTFGEGGSFTAGAGSIVDFAGSREALVNGSTTFANVTCSKPGKRLLFADGAKMTTTENLSVVGTGGNRVTMCAASAGGTWTLDTSAGGAVLGETDISDCRSVAEIKVMGGQGANNENVTFVSVTPGETVTWTGAKGTSWNEAGNWTSVHDGERLPVATDNVVIPAGCAAYPELTLSTQVASLQVASGARLSVGAATLTVTGAATFAGDVSATTGGFAIGGDVAWSGTFDAGTSTVVLNGTSQSFAPSASKYQTLAIVGTAVRLQDSLTCVSLEIGDGTAATELAVVEGATVKTTFFTVAGEPEAKNATLRCQTAGKFWNLVAVKNDVTGATVSGSDASKGVAVVPVSSEGTGENPNWYFVDTRTHYSGGAWPTLTETTELVIDSGISATLPGDATIRTLTLGAGASLQVSSVLETKGPVVLENESTLTWDKPGKIGGALTLLDGALLTHTVNGTTEKYRLILDIAGDGYVAETAGIDVSAKGHYGAGAGPGGSSSSQAAGHGGRGRTGGGLATSCYGSVFCPTNLGSCGNWYRGSPSIAPGGGAAILSFGGSLTLDGSIRADAGPVGEYYSGSGGSVNLTCAHLVGAGTISACGSRTTGAERLGGGGRVAVILTEQPTLAPFAGTVNTYAGTKSAFYTADGGGGTFYLETSSTRKAGVLYLQNKAEYYDGDNNDIIDIPSQRLNNDTRADWRATTIVLRLNAKMSLTEDLSVAGLSRENNSGRLFLNGKTLSVYARRPKNWPKKGLPSWVVPGKDASGNSGNVVWCSGFSVIIR